MPLFLVCLSVAMGKLTRCSYEHHSINEPAILLGGAFIVEIVEHEEDRLEQKEEKIHELEK